VIDGTFKAQAKWVGPVSPPITRSTLDISFFNSFKDNFLATVTFLVIDLSSWAIFFSLSEPHTATKFALIEFAISGKKVIASKIAAHKEINDHFIKIFLVENKYQNYIDKVKQVNNYQKKNKKNNLKKLDPKYHFEQVIKLYYSVI